jgi:ATP phosphoribosyltransferase regulatory subunit HisZ
VPVDVSIDRDNNLIRRRISGVVSIDEMVASLEDTVRHPEFRPGMNDLTDLREHVHQTSSDDVRKAAQAIKERSHLTGDIKLALVVSRTVSYGLTRMFQMLADESNWEIAIFDTPEEAELWLGI